MVSKTEMIFSLMEQIRVAQMYVCMCVCMCVMCVLCICWGGQWWLKPRIECLHDLLEEMESSPWSGHNKV
jgi:hypothetical protein